MEIKEGNKLIADFTGYLERAIKEKDPYLYAMKHAYENNSLKYHESWDWLMPVVEKIESTLCKGCFSVIVKDRCCEIIIIPEIGNSRCLMISDADSKIKVTWKVVVAFIQWYNKNKP